MYTTDTHTDTAAYVFNSNKSNILNSITILATLAC